MKKILSFVLAFAMIMAVTSTAFAATWDSSSLTGSFYTTGSIGYTINIQHLLSLVKLLNPRRIHRNVRL